MKTKLFAFLLAAAASAVIADDKGKTDSDKSLGDRTKEVVKKAGEATKDAGRAVVKGTKKAADVVVDAVTPDSDAAKVGVKLEGRKIDMPHKIAAGKTAFVVTNAGTERHNFEIRGQGLDKKFFMSLDPKETKTLNVDLKAGTYEVVCPMKEHDSEGMKTTLKVE